MTRHLSMAAAILFLTAGAAYGQPTSVASEPEIVALLDSGRSGEAARRLDRLIEQRLPADGKPRPDPVLDRLVGEVLVGASPGIARDLLARAAERPPAAARARTLLLLASAEESLGRAGAEAHYRALSADSGLDARQRQRAVAGEARLLMARDPVAASQRLAAYLAAITDPKWRWEAELLASRSARLQGRTAEAKVALEAASQHAWSGLPGEAAVQRVASDRAVIAGMAGDRATLISLSALGAAGEGWTRGASDLVPPCGVGGLREEDHVVVAFVAGPLGQTRAEIVAASRPGIVPSFLDGLTRPQGLVGSGQVKPILLRCSTAPRAPLGSAPSENPIVSWSAQLGAYPLLGGEEEQSFAAAAARLSEREARFGKESIFLIPPLAALLSAGGEALSDQAGRERLLGYAQRTEAILAKSGAPADARLSAALTSIALQVATQRLSQGEALKQVNTLILRAAGSENLSTDILLMVGGGSGWLSAGSREFELSVAQQSLETLSKRLDGNDPRRRALAVRLARLMRELGDETGAGAVERENRLPSNLCAAAAPAPRYLSSDIRDQDYPEDAIAAGLQGRVSLEFSIDPAGQLRDARVLEESPPFVFTAVTLARAPTIRYEPARKGSSPVTCVGMAQTVHWRLPPP